MPLQVGIATTGFVPPDHPLPAIRTILNAALIRLNADFNAVYAATWRDSIAPEKLLRTQMLQAIYGIRSERALCEHLGYNMLFRWFVGALHAYPGSSKLVFL